MGIEQPDWGTLSLVACTESARDEDMDIAFTRMDEGHRTAAAYATCGEVTALELAREFMPFEDWTHIKPWQSGSPF